MMMVKLSMAIKCTSITVHFDGVADAPVLCGVHRPMQHVQSYSGSHWMPPSGNYSLCAASVAAGVTAKKTTIKQFTNFAGHLDGRGSAPVQYLAHHPMEELQGYVAGHHWVPPSGKYCGQ